MQFSYYAPAWLFLKSFNFHLKAESVGRLSSSFCFRMSRVIPSDAGVWSMIEYGKFTELRGMLDRSNTSPYDVTDYGSSILYVRESQSHHIA